MTNEEETHFVFSMTNGKTLDFTNDAKVRNGVVHPCSEGMQILLRLRGSTDDRMETQFFAFKEQNQ